MAEVILFGIKIEDSGKYFTFAMKHPQDGCVRFDKGFYIDWPHDGEEAHECGQVEPVRQLRIAMGEYETLFGDVSPAYKTRKDILQELEATVYANAAEPGDLFTPPDGYTVDSDEQTAERGIRGILQWNKMKREPNTSHYIPGYTKWEYYGFHKPLHFPQQKAYTHAKVMWEENRAMLFVSFFENYNNYKSYDVGIHLVWRKGGEHGIILSDQFHSVAVCPKDPFFVGQSFLYHKISYIPIPPEADYVIGERDAR